MVFLVIHIVTFIFYIYDFHHLFENFIIIRTLYVDNVHSCVVPSEISGNFKKILQFIINIRSHENNHSFLLVFINSMFHGKLSNLNRLAEIINSFDSEFGILGVNLLRRICWCCKNLTFSAHSHYSYR